MLLSWQPEFPTLLVGLLKYPIVGEVIRLLPPPVLVLGLLKAPVLVAWLRCDRAVLGGLEYGAEFSINVFCIH